MAIKSTSLRTTRGVMTTSSSVRATFLELAPKSLPSTGMSCKRGMPCLPDVLLSRIRPPSTSVSPERTATLLLNWRCKKLRWPVVASSVPTSVTAWLICMVTMLPALTEGVTDRVTPVSLY